jgi:hypothetical protein
MFSDETPTLIGRVPAVWMNAPRRDDARWVIPPLVLGRRASAAVPTATPCLPCGSRLGAYMVAEARGEDDACAIFVVRHAERGSLHMARVVQREHAAIGPAMLEAARRIEQHPQRNLLTILESGWTSEPTPRAFVVHDRVVGRSVASLLSGRGGIEWLQVLAIGLQCAEALEALHGLGLAHAALTPASAALVLVAGDQFRVVLGGLDHAQPIRPGAGASQEPRVRDDLLALGHMLTALAASSEASGSRVPEMLSGLLARMIDPRAAVRPASAGELFDLLAAVRDHVDPDLSAAHMLGEAFRRICGDFEVSVEESAPVPALRIEVSPPVPIAAPSRPRGAWWRRLSLMLAGAAVLVVGAAQLRPAALTVSAALERDDEAGLARLDRWQIPALRPAPAPAAVPIVALPGYKDPPSRSTARRGAPRLKRSPTPPQEVTPVEAGSAVVDASSESREKPDLLPVPIPVRGALLGTEGVTVLMARRMP